MKTNIWSYYAGDTSVITELATYINEDSFVGSTLKVSPPHQKVLDLEVRINLLKDMIYTLISLVPVLYIAISVDWAKARAEQWDSVPAALIGILSVPILFATCKTLNFFSGRNKNIRKYVKRFEELGGEFFKTFTPDKKPFDQSLKVWCKSVLVEKATTILICGQDGESYRPAFNRALDLLVSVHILSEDEIKVWYKEIFDEAIPLVKEMINPSSLSSSKPA